MLLADQKYNIFIDSGIKITRVIGGYNLSVFNLLTRCYLWVERGWHGGEGGGGGWEVQYVALIHFAHPISIVIHFILLTIPAAL